MATFDIEKLDGGQFRWESKKVKTKGGSIVFVLHHPTQAELVLATELAGAKRTKRGALKLKKNAPVSDFVQQTELLDAAKRPLACLCIDNVEGLDEWADLDATHRQLTKRLRILSDAAQALIPGVILEEIADELQKASSVVEDDDEGEDDEEGKD